MCSCSLPFYGQLFVGRLLDIDDYLLVHPGSQLEALLVFVLGNGTGGTAEKHMGHDTMRYVLSIYVTQE